MTGSVVAVKGSEVGMIDREKILKGLECCATAKSVNSCKACPYYNTKYEGEPICMDGRLIRDAYALLKEQEQRINELEEKLRLLEYGDQDILQSGMMPAT